VTPTPRKPRVDWDAARAFYLSLGPEERTYRRVVAEYGVSEKTVQKWAARQDWPAQAAAFDAAVSNETTNRIIRTRAQRVEDTLRYVDRVIDRAAGMVDTSDVKHSDVAALVKLAELLVGEPTDRIQISQLQPLLDAYDRALDELRDLATDHDRAAQIVKRLDEELLAVAARARGEQP
jgi:hypothetical protein